MKKYLIILVLLALFLSSCNLLDPSDEVPEWYPSTRMYSSYDMDIYKSKFNQFSNTYNLEKIKVGVDSINAHMKYLQIDDNFLICDFTSSSDSIEVFKNTIMNYYRYWWRIFSNKRFEIDSCRISISDGGSVGGTFYIKNPYDPSLNILKNELGYLRASVDKNGRLFYLRSTIVPHLRVPQQPLINKNEAIDIIEGYEFTIDVPLFSYYKIITMTGEYLTDPDLSIYLNKTYQDNVGCSEYRLVWRFKCREALVYIDAMTGEIIGHKVTILFM